MLNAQSEILKLANKTQKKLMTFNQLKRNKFNKRKFGNIEITEFPINSYVLVNYEGEDNKPPTKLHTFLRDR